MWPNPQCPAELVTVTEEILHEELYFLKETHIISKQTKTALAKI